MPHFVLHAIRQRDTLGWDGMNIHYTDTARQTQSDDSPGDLFGFGFTFGLVTDGLLLTRMRSCKYVTYLMFIQKLPFSFSIFHTHEIVQRRRRCTTEKLHHIPTLNHSLPPPQHLPGATEIKRLIYIWLRKMHKDTQSNFVRINISWIFAISYLSESLSSLLKSRPLYKIIIMTQATWLSLDKRGSWRRTLWAGVPVLPQYERLLAAAHPQPPHRPLSASSSSKTTGRHRMSRKRCDTCSIGLGKSSQVTTMQSL